MKVERTDTFNNVKRAVPRSEIESLVKDLVRIPSHSQVPTREKEIAEFLHEFLTDEGIDSKLRKVEKDRYNVIATLRGSGSGSSLMLNGHLDTVPPYDMDIPPFTPKVEGGKLYGRGSLDMKGGLGAMAATMLALDRAKVDLKGNVYLTAVVGEEERSEGTEDIVIRGPKADMAIVGEPTDLEIQPSHRGLEWLEVHFYGKAAHGGQASQGVNAISMAAKFVNLLDTELLPRIRERKSAHTDPPTLNVGLIQGGQQPSSVADHCVVKMDRRWTPEEDLQQVFKEIYKLFDELKRDDPRFKAELKRDSTNMKTMTHVPNVVPVKHRLVKSLRESVKTVTGKPAKLTSFWGWTDAALLTHFGKTPTVIFGPGGKGAHSRVEYVLVDDLQKCMHVYAKTAMDISGE
ncbi:MAG: M20 family metallopeptidase [Thermoplasmata archaeon]|nr:M20 family metallopeptidase [Thermoplasmata archaeon]